MPSTEHRPRWTRLLPELGTHTGTRQLGTLLPLLASTPIANMGMSSVPSLSDLCTVEQSYKPRGPVIVFGSTLKTCAICLEDYLPGDRLRLLDSCGHMFHVKCLDAWLDQSCDGRRQRARAVCPVCKVPVVSGDGGATTSGGGGGMSGEGGGSRRERDDGTRSANIQLIDVSVHQSWADWFQSLVKLYYDGITNHEHDER